jgi:hypothetical protein
MPADDLLTAPVHRRRRRWRLLALLLLIVTIAVVGGGWWALSTNQTGQLISRLFSNRLPGHLEIDHSEFAGLDRLVLTGVRLMPEPGVPAMVTVERITVKGELWKGDLERIALDGVRFDATADHVRFLHRLIKAEVAIPGSGNPSLLHLDFTGSVTVDGKTVIDGAQVGVDATGPVVAVRGTARLADQPIAVEVGTSGVGDERTYRITLLEGRLPLWRLSDWLADLRLLPRLPAVARPWVPEHADAADTTVVADRHWEHFTGEAKARWDLGRGQAELQIDQRFIRLTRLGIRDEGLGALDGAAMIDTDRGTVSVTASTWTPGPRVPIPAVVPTAAILQALPQAQLDATSVAEGWDLALRLSGTGRATLATGPGKPLTIDGGGVALSLLQSFLPGGVNLAAGNATSLHAVVGADGLQDFTATVEQARLLWQGWALGSVDGLVALRLPDTGGIDLRASLPALGSLRWRGDASGGQLRVDLTAAEALVVRLKGPQVLPDLSGAITLDTRLSRQGEILVAGIDQLRLANVGITDVLRTLDTDLTGTVRMAAARVDAHLLGRITRGEFRLPGQWRGLARHSPRFNAQVSVGNGVLLAENILVRATDTAGEPLIDGYSAGLRGRFSLTDLKGTILGVVDHADLGWLNTLVPIEAGSIGGEGAVTFTAEVQRDGVRSVDGFFMPLDAHLKLGGLQASGIKGGVKFRIARPKGE